MMRIIALACLLASALQPAPVRADPQESETTAYYDVDGDTVEDLRAEMTAKGPHGFWAYTEWYVQWSSTCEVSVRVSFTYPRWTGYDEADDELRARWDKFMENLETHEDGYAQHGRDAAQEIEDTQCADDPYQILRNWGNEDKNYDAETNHGETQGAVF